MNVDAREVIRKPNEPTKLRNAITRGNRMLIAYLYPKLCLSRFAPYHMLAEKKC